MLRWKDVVLMLVASSSKDGQMVCDTVFPCVGGK